nr:hypothetical protein [Micromonospora sp. DSM 115978]
MNSPQPPRHHRRRWSPVRRRGLIALLAVLATTIGVGTVAALSAAAPDTGTDGLAAGSGTPQPEWSGTSPGPVSTATVTPSPAPTPTPGEPSPAGACGRPAAATPKTKITEVRLPASVVGYGREGDTDPLPMAIAARPDGGSWLAWLAPNGRVHLARLDCDDRIVGKPTSFAGVDLQDVQADRSGGVILLTRRGNCGDGPLCGGASSPCSTMHMIRFDDTGGQVWDRQVTNLTGNRAGYDDGARFVWWYQHHGRLATDGKNYAAYFGIAITVRNGACVDIHQGDRMQVVNAAGALVPGHRDSFDVGCSHSWGTRIVWDPRPKRFAMVCATDNACRIARPDPYRTVAAGACDGTLFGGDLVLARGRGYWTAWSQGGRVRLDRFTDGPSDVTVATSARARHPHLVSYGTGRMLLSWASGSAMAAQVYDAGSGRTIGGTFTIKVPDHNFQTFKSYADGSVAYPAAGGSDRSIRIARVLPLAD